MAYLEVTDLHYTYPGSREEALKGVDLQVDRGELIALVGPNASGKSTLALVLKGIIQPRTGTVNLAGRHDRGRAPDPRVGLLLANPENQLVTSIVEEDVAFALEAAGRPQAEIREAVDAMLHRLGIQDLGLRSPHRLSGGEQQLVALAGALIAGPGLLVLDEPTTYLDPPGRRRVMETLKSLTVSGMTVILITHDMEEALKAQRVCVMVSGRVAAIGSPDRIFQDREVVKAGNLRVPFGIRQPAAAASSPSRSAGNRREPVRADGDPCLTYRDVSYAHRLPGPGADPVLREVSTVVNSAAIAVLCGANGAGKSTMMQLGNGLLRPVSGQVLYRGRSLEALNRRRGHVASCVGLLFQKPERQVFSETVYEDVAFGPANLGLPEETVRTRVTSSLQWVGLDETLWRRSPMTLSGGQLRRVAVAGVLALGAEVLLLDEPTDGLDPVSVDLFWERMRDYVAETGTAVYLATHRVPDQLKAGDALDFLGKGTILSSGRAADVLLDPDLALDEVFLPAHLRYLRRHRDEAPGEPADITETAVRSLFGL